VKNRFSRSYSGARSSKRASISSVRVVLGAVVVAVMGSPRVEAFGPIRR
jgi:hypothetical protein